MFHGTAIVIAVLVLLSAGQPLFTEDTWWHLSMGRAYASLGPWLEHDPNLFTAAGPPSPAAWLSSLSLYGVSELAGFQALRVTHVSLVALIIVFAWRALRRVSDSPAYASAATGIFVSLAAYRLFQLRPDLITIFAAILVVWFAIVKDAPITTVPTDTSELKRSHRNRIVAVFILMVVWANAHAGFLLGPILLAAALVAVIAARLLRTPHLSSPNTRLRMLWWCVGLGFAATLINPEGLTPHLLYFTAGDETPDLAVVVDEWQRIDLLSLPPTNLPPSLHAWGLVWVLLLTAPLALALSWWQAGSGIETDRSERQTSTVDPALVGMAALSIVAMLAAVRFLWMGVFVLMMIGACGRDLGLFEGARNRSRPAGQPTSGIYAGTAIIAGLLVAALLAYGFVTYGAWPMISKGVDRASYARPYTSAKNNAHAVWFLEDTGLEGNLYNDYASGNFLGYWLSPRLRTFVNGSLNVPKHVLDASFVIGRRGWESAEGIEAVLDRYGVDVFFATGTPRAPLPGRPVVSTTTHLEQTPGWMLVFRSLSSAIYLRTNERNRANLERVRVYYEQNSVPFDVAGKGLDVERVIQQAPQWAIAHGLIPHDFKNLQRSARGPGTPGRAQTRERLSGILALIGLYERAAAFDRETVRRSPTRIAPLRRLIWSLLHQQKLDEAAHRATRLQSIALPRDQIASLLVSSALHAPNFDEAQRRALIAAVPMMTRQEARQFGSEFAPPEVR